MPLNIGTKVYRNLQEQVGYNSECIEKIFETIDGLNIQDNVVIVPDMSYILSEEELEIIRREVAFIVYDNQLYIKRTEDSSLAYFDVVFSISGSGGVISFNSKEIQVTLSNGALGIVVTTVQTYNKSQIDSLISPKADTTYVDAQLATKANLSGANFTGPVAAPSIIEINSGYSFTLVDKKAYSDKGYCSMNKTGNKLTIVVTGTLNVPTDVTLSDYTLLLQVTANIPSVVGSKVYGLVGARVDQKNIDVFSNTFLDHSILYANVSKTNDASIDIRIYATNTAESQLTKERDYAFRYELTLLLSDNL